MVFSLLLASVAMFVGLINRVTMLQINRALAFAGDRDQGRTATVIYPHWASAPPDIAPRRPAMAAATQVVAHRGPPLAVEGVQVEKLVALASAADAIVEVAVAIGGHCRGIDVGRACVRRAHPD
jgi:hypothetical protein